MYIGSPFLVALCRLHPRSARYFTLIGLTIASLALALSSFCTTVPQLIGTQGILFGVGGLIAYCPCTIYIDEWFVRRKGLAYGIVWSAAGVGGAILPLVLQALLDKLGFKSAVRICAAILFGCSAPLAFFIKPRLPPAAVIHRRPLNMRFVLSKQFILHQTANIVQATGYFLPSIYLPTYARTTFGTGSFLSALTVMLLNLAVTIGLVVMGSLSDRLQVTTCMIISASGAAISVLCVWGLSASLAGLYVFCILYGLFAGGWAAIWPGVMRDVAKASSEGDRDRQGASDGESHGPRDGYGADPIMVHGHLCVGRGLGNIISGPLSGSLLRQGTGWKGNVLGGFGSGYGVLILYTGVTGLVSGMGVLWRWVGLL